MSELAGLGVLVVSLAIAYIMYQFGRVFKQSADLDERFNLVEMLLVDKKAKELGFDLEKEKLKSSLLHQAGKKSIKSQLKRQILEEYFPEKRDNTKNKIS